ncbi:MAG TPA: UDP-N-acetylmuramate dehydrogenase [Polyangium sp.]|nr:UDP-N-acetylmuramate dehydrogenase [Polyangium sp.]
MNLSNVLEDEPLAGKTTFGLGGPASFYLEARDEHSLQQALTWTKSRGLPLTVLGGGSNVLVADNGVDGLVLRVGIRGIQHEPTGDRMRVFVGAGESWDTFVEKAVAEKWAGIECLSGIPGDVGAAPIQNIGAYGQEVGEVIEYVLVIDRRNGESKRLAHHECTFAYRDSIFKGACKNQYIVIGVSFLLVPNGPPAVRYAELQRYMKELGKENGASLADVRAAVLELRGRKSMLLDPRDENVRSAGSFFLNPILDQSTWSNVRARIEASGVLSAGESIPTFPAGPGHVKLAAAWLIERAGFSKGTAEGPVGLSTKHTLAIVNRGGARATDILRFARRIRGGVFQKFGVQLIPEPVMLGFDPQETSDLLAAH